MARSCCNLLANTAHVGFIPKYDIGSGTHCDRTALSDLRSLKQRRSARRWTKRQKVETMSTTPFPTNVALPVSFKRNVRRPSQADSSLTLDGALASPVKSMRSVV